MVHLQLLLLSTLAFAPSNEETIDYDTLPYFALVYGSGTSEMCGGALISRRWVAAPWARLKDIKANSLETFIRACQPWQTKKAQIHVLPGTPVGLAQAESSFVQDHKCSSGVMFGWKIFQLVDQDAYYFFFMTETFKNDTNKLRLVSTLLINLGEKVVPCDTKSERYMVNDYTGPMWWLNFCHVPNFGGVLVSKSLTVSKSRTLLGFMLEKNCIGGRTSCFFYLGFYRMQISGYIKNVEKSQGKRTMAGQRGKTAEKDGGLRVRVVVPVLVMTTLLGIWV